MAEAMGVNLVVVQPEELKFDLTRAEGERLSSSAKLTNPTDLPVHFAVQVTDPDISNYEVKPSRGTVPPSGTRRINVTAHGRGGLPRVELRKVSVLLFDVLPTSREEEIDFVEQDYPPPGRNCSMCERVLPVRWVQPETAIPDLLHKFLEEMSQEDYGLALETLGEAIELQPNDFLYLCRALVNHFLGQEEGVKRDIEESERLSSISMLTDDTEATKAHSASSFAYNIISDAARVPTYTMEKLYGKQMIVDWSVAVTENQRLYVEIHFKPSIMLRPDGDLELSLIMESLRFKDVRSERTADHLPDHFLQSLKIKVCPTEKLSTSFSRGFGLIKWSPGNELNPVSVQQGSSSGVAVTLNVSASPNASVQYSGNNSSGRTFPAFGFKKATSDGHAYVNEYELRTFEDGSSTQNLGSRRYFKPPKIHEAVRGEVNYSNLGKDEAYKGTWKVSKAAAMELRNELGFTFSLEAKLPAVLRCRMLFPSHWVEPPEHKLEVLKLETRRTCVFAIAELTRFIRMST